MLETNDIRLDFFTISVNFDGDGSFSKESAVFYAPFYDVSRRLLQRRLSASKATR